jgi:hypothetical protein
MSFGKQLPPKPTPASRYARPMRRAHVRAEAVADARHLVDEGDLRRQEGVRGVLDHLGGVDVGDDDRRAQRDVEARGPLRGGAVRRPQHDAIGLHEVLHRRALAQELGIGHHRDAQRRVAQVLAHDARDEVAGADGHRALVDDDDVAIQVLGDGARRALHVGHVGAGTAGDGGRVDGDEDVLGIAAAVRVVRREAEPAGERRAADDVLQPRLEDGQLARLQPDDLLLGHVQADHVVAQIGQAGPRHQPDVSRPNHADSCHVIFSSPLPSLCPATPASSWAHLLEYAA